MINELGFSNSFCWCAKHQFLTLVHYRCPSPTLVRCITHYVHICNFFERHGIINRMTTDGTPVLEIWDSGNFNDVFRLNSSKKQDTNVLLSLEIPASHAGFQI